TWSGLDLLDERSLPAEDALKRNLLKHSPTLVGLQSRLVAAQVSQHLADLESYPDFSLGADWTMIGEGNPIQRDEGDDALSISLAIELPLQQGRIDSGRRQAMEERRSTVERIQRSRWRLLAALQGAVSAHEDAHRRIDLFQDRLLPLAEMTYQTSLAAYQSGEVGFQEMLDAARVVLDFRLSAARARADAALAYADLNGLLPFALLSSEDQN
ncbi:MAG: TolC family protein, partial [Planctomycetota bacterium]